MKLPANIPGDLELYDPIHLEYILSQRRIYSEPLTPEEMRRQRIVRSIRSSVSDRLFKALWNDLTPMQREIISLSYFYDLSQREIAAVFKCTQNKIYWTHRVAIKKLHRALVKADIGVDELLKELKKIEIKRTFYY